MLHPELILQQNREQDNSQIEKPNKMKTGGGHEGTNVKQDYQKNKQGNQGQTQQTGSFPRRLESGKIVGNPEEWNTIKDNRVFTRGSHHKPQQTQKGEVDQSGKMVQNTKDVQVKNKHSALHIEEE